jgi:pimeloyl-ACP methyl ester carboxylesterase
MPSFQSGDLNIVYDDFDNGGANPILLVHGFATNRLENWGRTGWFAAFEQKRRRVIAFDHRGHGESDKPHDRSAYSMELMLEDAIGLMDHIGLEKADLLGFSMGAGVSLGLLLRHGDRFGDAIIGGVGGDFFDETKPRPDLAGALLVDDPETLTDPIERGFRIFAEQQGEDRQALSACAARQGRLFDKDDLALIRNRVLVVAGQHDDLAGDPQALADLIPGAKSTLLPGCDHMYSIPHPLFKAAVMDFLEGWMD